MDRRLFAILLVGAAGCQSAQRAYDPFLGRTTVPPPGTMAPMQVQPYYGGSAPANLSAPPITAPITPGVPATPPAYQGQPSSAPPGGYQYLPGARRPIGGTKLSQQTEPEEEGTTPIDLDAMIAAQRNQAVSDSAVQPASFEEAALSMAATGQLESPIRIVEPTLPKPSTPNVLRSEPTTGTTTLSIPASPIRDLAELPKPKRTAQPAVAPSNSSSPALPGNGSAETKRNDAESTTRPDLRGATYDHDAKYTWLKGQLEYSQSKQIWKLRYIPVDGTTDDFGGSVVLSAGAYLDGYKPGDFVTVYGQVGAQQTSTRSFAPLYQLSRIERQ